VAQETESDQITKLENIKCRSPRATFEITFYNQSFKMHGQSFDFTVKYKQVIQMFVLPNTTHHNYVVIALDPPLRKGNTMYSHIVAIFPQVRSLIFVCVCVCVCVCWVPCVYVCMYMYICVYLYVRVCACACFYVHACEHATRWRCERQQIKRTREMRCT
jgi:hypothetical protein